MCLGRNYMRGTTSVFLDKGSGSRVINADENIDDNRNMST